MKICVVQTKSLKGNIEKNIQNHIRIIKKAINLNADLIVFPELSITNYEPKLAKDFATSIDDIIFEPFQELATKNNTFIGIGMPLKTTQGIQISIVIFRPNETPLTYAKQMLHTDELPYFVGGNTQVFLNIKGRKIAFGICYETLQLSHFLNAKQNGADIYIASVAKPKGGIKKAFTYFPKIALEFNTPILMSNCIGNCDNFLSVGQTVVWNQEGKVIEQLDGKNQGIIVYDTETEVGESFIFSLL